MNSRPAQNETQSSEGEVDQGVPEGSGEGDDHRTPFFKKNHRLLFPIVAPGLNFRI